MVWLLENLKAFERSCGQGGGQGWGRYNARERRPLLIQTRAPTVCYIVICLHESHRLLEKTGFLQVLSLLCDSLAMCVAETTCRALRMLDPKSLTAWYSSDCSRGGCAGQRFSEDLAKIRASLKLFYLYNGSLYTTGNNGFQSGALSLVTDRILRVFQ